MNINTIVFDLGGVLIDWNPRYLYRKLVADEAKIESFLTDVCHGAWNEQQDAGRPFREAIEELLPRHPDHADLIRAYFDRWPEMIQDQIPGTVKILEALKSTCRYEIYALSNWSAETFPIALARFAFFEHFDAILLSGKEKLIKPDAKFFALLTSRHGVDPRRSVFIDDVSKNIDAAKALGFSTVLFKSPEQLREELTALGVAF